jgi:large subunit ribosomal protein L17
MRHRKMGRKFGRSSSHRLAMFKNLASSLLLTERDAEFDENKPKVKGRIITTVEKAKEARRLIERCITIARHALVEKDAADKLGTNAERGSDEWKRWRTSPKWQQWAQAMSPVVAARRRCLRMLGDKQAVRILFNDVAPRFADRKGGYTRVLKLPKPRLGDAGARAILEFVGVRDRIVAKSQKPAFDADAESEKPAETAQ